MAQGLFEIGVAVVRVKKQGLTVAPLGTDVTLERGDPVVALASPRSGELGERRPWWTYLGEFEDTGSIARPRHRLQREQSRFGGGGLLQMSGTW